MLEPANSMPRESLLAEIRTLIRKSGNLMHLRERQMNETSSLGPGGLNLDSIDALEVILTIEKRFGFKVEDPNQWRTHFRTLGSLADFVQGQIRGGRA